MVSQKIKCRFNLHNYVVLQEVKGYLHHKNYNKIYNVTKVCTHCGKQIIKKVTKH
jgi:hypothetical protein